MKITTKPLIYYVYSMKTTCLSLSPSSTKIVDSEVILNTKPHTTARKWNDEN